MKKLFSVLLSLLLLLGVCGAQAQDALLSVDEMLTLCDSLLSDALSRQAVAAQAAEDGGYAFDYGAYTLYSPDSELTAQSHITGLDLNNASELIADMRGICPTDPLTVLLDAYPLDNVQLQGTYSEAVLYINGLLPGTVTTGRTIRSGSHMLVVEHTVYTADAEDVEKCCMVYTLENNFVIAVQLRLDVQEMTLNEAQDEIDALSVLQETDEYSVYSSAQPEPLTREDLSFGPFDFLTVTPESAVSTLGSANSDTWAQDGEGFMRSMQWTDIQLVFRYDSLKENSTLALLEIYGESYEGPRNLHIGDSPASVISRFEHENAQGNLLYGDGETAPYGKYEMRSEGAYILYAASVEDGTVLLALSFINDALVDMTCTYL